MGSVNNNKAKNGKNRRDEEEDETHYHQEDPPASIATSLSGSLDNTTRASTPESASASASASASPHHETTTTSSGSGSGNGMKQQQQQLQRPDPPEGQNLKTSAAWKDEGNAAFGQEDFDRAVYAYTQGLELLLQQQEQSPSSSSSSSFSSDAVVDLVEARATLYSNRAMAHLRRGDYGSAQQDCSYLLDKLHYKSNPKVWYRRACAREAQAQQLLLQLQLQLQQNLSDTSMDNLYTKQALALLQLAKRDLRGALESLERPVHGGAGAAAGAGGGKQQQNKHMTLIINGLSVKIQRLIDKLQVQSQQSQAQQASQKQRPKPELVRSKNSRSSTTSRSTATATTISASSASTNDNNNMPSAVQQRQDVLQLLVARQEGLEQYYSAYSKSKQQQQQQQPQKNDRAVENNVLQGEAFFLMDWNWWCRWCHYVRLFTTTATTTTTTTTTTSGEAASPKTTTMPTAVKKNGIKYPSFTMTPAQILYCLPGGAMLPQQHAEKEKKNGDDNDDNSTSSSSSSENDNDNKSPGGPPGPIDNSALFLLPPRTNGTSSSSSLSSITQQIFRQQWYHPHTTPHVNAGSVDKQQQQQQPPCLLLQPELVRGYHYEVLPREVYFALCSWYGEVTPSVCRRAVVPKSSSNNNNKQKLVLELYNYYHNNNNATRIAEQQQQITSNGSQKNGGGSSATRCSACQALTTSKARCKRCLSVHYCDRRCQESHWPFHKQTCVPIVNDDNDNNENENENTSAANPGATSRTLLSTNNAVVPPPSGSFLDRGRAVVGLNNLGNTCFLNSAVQSLSHATPLTRHFLSNRFQDDLNPNNPLGTGGKLANAYSTAMKDMWMRFQNSSGVGGGSLSHHSISPVSLKRAIALFAPRFAGCQQHDAQEFLAFLLDGLHEDCNRVKDAPYVTMPDVTAQQNMAVEGARAWDAHRRRNDSLVHDSFYGQFKSTCVCPHCDRVSVSFDAFNHVSLELPPQQQANPEIPFCVLFFPQGATIPLRCSVPARRTSSLEELRATLSELVGVALDRIVMAEVCDHVITGLAENRLISDIANDVWLIAYEVEPLTTDCFHAITSHVIVDGNNDNRQQPLHEPFGVPFLTSFPADLTCRQVWDHFWNRVAPMVEPEGRDILQICLHVNNRAMPIFPAPDGEDDNDSDGEEKKTRAQEEEKTEEGEQEMREQKVLKSPLIPRDCDKPLISFLPKGSMESFLFVRLEWIDPTLFVDANCDDESNEKVEPKIIEQRFIALDLHSSWIEATERQLALNGAKGLTLDQCFNHYTKPERLDEHNMWYCSTCKEHVRAMKTMELWRLPNILIVHLKRFEFKHAFRRDKLDTFVDFPLEGLDMNAHCASVSDSDAFVDSRVPADYDLFAVVNHYGRMGFGHYTAFARKWDETGMSPDWTLFDDSSTKNVGNGRGQGGDVEAVVSPAAYVLFYRRRVFN